MENVEDTDASECFGNDMGENTAPIPRIHRCELREDEIKLRQCVDHDERISGFEVSGIPEEHPSPDADVAEGIVWNEFDDFVEFLAFLWFVGIESPKSVEPGHLEELLREEEGSDEVRLRREEGDVGIVDVHH